VELPPGLTQIIVVVRRYGGQMPLDILESQVKKRMEELWQNVHNRSENVEFREYIEVKVVALPDKESDKFQEKVKELRKLLASCTSELSAKVPASSFSHSSKLLWEQIKQNRRLDIPSHKVIVATVFCSRIVEEALKSFYYQKKYEALQGEESPRGFKEASDTLLDSVISTYDQEAKMYDDGVRDRERERLSQEIKKILTVHAKKLIIKMREKKSEQFQHEFAMNMNSMEENVEPSFYDTWIESCAKEFMNSCEELKEFDADFFHDKCKDLQSELHIYIRSKLLRLTEERARKELELAQQRNDKNVQDLCKKLEETMIDRQHMDEIMKLEKEKQEEEKRKATEEVEREYKNIVDVKEMEIIRLQRELEEAHARPAFSLGLGNILRKLMDYFTT